MIETFLFGIVLCVKDANYSETIESIVGNQDFFIKHVKLVIIDAQQDQDVSVRLENLEDVYLGNVVYIKAESEHKIAAYNKGLSHCKAKYVHFTDTDIIYKKGTLESVKDYSEHHKAEILAIHTKYLSDLSKRGKSEPYKESNWDFTENLSYLPLFISRYFIKYTCLEGLQFEECYHEDAFKHFMICCFEKQTELTILENTLMYYCESQERNLTTYEVKNEKWWYIPQMEEMILPLLRKHGEEGTVPKQIQNLVYYMIRIKFYHNMNSRYDYVLNHEEVKRFLKLVKEALQYIDDSVIRNVKNAVVTPKFMTYYFLKLKYGTKDYCADIQKDKQGKLAFVVKDEVFATLDDMIVSLQRFEIDRETGERRIEAEWFYNYLIENSKCDVQIEVNGKPAQIEVNEKNAEELCFGKVVRRKFKFTICIPKEERKLYNKIRFYVTIRGEKYMIQAKYARRKLLARLRTKIKQGRFAKFFQKITKSKYIFFYGIGKIFLRQQPNQVVMLSDSRAELSGNLAFIDEELKEKGFDVQYFFKRSLKEPKTLKEVRVLCRLMATSKYILLDDFYPIIYPLKIRKGTKLIQVWHAMGAFKTVGFSRLGKPGGPSPTSLTHRNYTDAITSADGIRENYAEAFWMDVKNVHATGIPRTDIFFDAEYIAQTKERLYTNYPMLKEKKVVLFAPTFRGAGQNSAHYNFQWLDFEKMEAELGDEYIVIVKLHPFIKNTSSVPKESDMFLDMTAEREINDLLFVTDILITDYSSVIFEASLLNINTIFYVPDLEEYTASRDFYYPFERYTFGEIAENLDTLLYAIQHPKMDQKKLEEFKEHFCGACDGHATERFVETLFDKE